MTTRPGCVRCPERDKRRISGLHTPPTAMGSKDAQEPGIADVTVIIIDTKPAVTVTLLCRCG
jgi:hypothetical protein